MLFIEKDYHENMSPTAWHRYHQEGCVGLFYFFICGSMATLHYSILLNGCGGNGQTESSPFHGEEINETKE